MARYTRKRSSGQSLTEYGLIDGLIVVGSLGALLFIGSQLSGLFGNLITSSNGTTIQATNSLNGGTSPSNFSGATFPMA